MSNNLGKHDVAGFEDLFDDLQSRFGAEQAREIIETSFQPSAKSDLSILAVKALGDLLHLYRTEAKELLHSLRYDDQSQQNIICLHAHKCKKDFRRIFRLYWLTMQAFYPAYASAIKMLDHPAHLSWSKADAPQAALVA